MRSFPISLLPLLSLLTACSDYALTGISSEDNAAPSDPSEATDGEEPAVTEEDEEIDSGLEPDEDCGFWVNNGMTGEAFTLSYPTYEMHSDEFNVVAPGDTIELWYSITADFCGDIEVLVMRYVLQDEVTFEDWLFGERDEEAYMRDPSDEFVFDKAAANGVAHDELHFTWSDGYFPLSYDNTGEMDTVLIKAGETKWFVFEFKNTELAPKGAIVNAFLSPAIWRDVGTNQEITGFDDGAEDIWTTTQFVN